MKNYWSTPQIVEWTQYLLDSYYYWMAKELIDRKGSPLHQSENLFCSSFAVTSHQQQQDPIFNYGNKTALNLWETSWNQFTQMPSRLSTEPENRDERARMLSQAKTQGYLSDYHGIRISRSGKRFLIKEAIIWNIKTPKNTVIGQAATFSKWTYLS